MPTAEASIDGKPAGTGPSTGKSVNIVAEPESIDGDVSSNQEGSLRQTSPIKQHRTRLGKRLSGRPPPSASSIESSGDLASLSQLDPQSSDNPANHHKDRPTQKSRQSHHASNVVAQVNQWLHQEKARRVAYRKGVKDGTARASTATSAATSILDKIHRHAPVHRNTHHRRTSSDLSEGSTALEELERILTGGLQLGESRPSEERKSSYVPGRRPSKLLLRNQSTFGASSDTDNRELEDLVPHADVTLDNSKTLSYSGGAAVSETKMADVGGQARKESEAWLQFKTEIVRLSHTLKLRGWRRIPMDRVGEIEVVRLSGALTNAVYVVSPPSELPPTTPDPRSSTSSVASKRQPPKLLLRIYGPQVEHLIDRDVELQILKRLAQKNIGPRMLGTFDNGRFEQFFHARTLTAQDLRNPQISKQIAKRMRELHDGIDLLEEERSAGPFIWQNWDKWVQRCEEVTLWIDQQISNGEAETDTSSSESWKKRGLVCGVPWPFFKETVNRYRKWLEKLYGDPAAIQRDLVFAHNDTQYGNLLRLEPQGESPLLMPANEHKQLVVIDFEYANANVPGHEFANHFTEWCYNYHEEPSYLLKTDRYPTPDEQKRFIEAYVQHRPFQSDTLSLTTSNSSSIAGAGNSISSFVLDSRAPPAQYSEDEKRREEAKETEIKRLMRETRLWRVANSAQWVAWGIVQAKVPGLDEALNGGKPNDSPTSEDTVGPDAFEQASTLGSDPVDADSAPVVEDAHDKRPEGLTAQSLAEGNDPPQDLDDEEGFDYLGYAQERAMFFWGDVLQLGIIKKEELPQELLEKVKIVKH